MRNSQTINKLQELLTGFQREIDNIDESIGNFFDERAGYVKIMSEKMADRDEAIMVLDAANLVRNIPVKAEREAILEVSEFNGYAKVLYMEMELVSKDELNEIINAYGKDLFDLNTARYNLLHMIKACSTEIGTLYGERLKSDRAKSAISKEMKKFISVVKFEEVC